jgi:hypothetical protein
LAKGGFPLIVGHLDYLNNRPGCCAGLCVQLRNWRKPRASIYLLELAMHSSSTELGSSVSTKPTALTRSEMRLLIRGTVFVHKPPLAFHQHCLQIVVRIASLIARCPVAYFEVHHILGCLVDQMMAIPGSRFEACAHSRRKLSATFIGMKDGTPLQDEDELILPGVCMAKRGNRIGC